MWINPLMAYMFTITRKYLSNSMCMKKYIQPAAEVLEVALESMVALSLQPGQADPSDGVLVKEE